MHQAQAAEAATTITTPDGLTIRLDWLYNGHAKLDASGVQVPGGATGHAIVYDLASGLMAAVRAPGFDARLEHGDATKLASALSFAGFTDWQLPSVPEAVHTVDYTREDPAADPSLYPDAVAGAYWTRQQTTWTLDESGSSRSFFVVYMCNGYVNGYYADYQLRARPVRRASPASQCLVIGQ